MGIIRLQIFLLLLLGSCVASAQKAKVFQNMYAEAKRTFDSGEYEKSYDLFNTIVAKPHKNNAFYNYAHYFSGLSAYHLNKTTEANSVLEKIINEEPKWKKAADVHYLIAANAFKIPDLEKSYTHLSLIEDSKFDEDIEQLIESIFVKTDSLDLLISLQQNHPEDLRLANLLALKIISSPLREAYQGQLEYLSQDYTLDSTLHLFQTPKQSVKKEEYTVAVLLPFHLENNKQPNRYSRFLEYYKGIQLATEQLSSEKIIINLVAYDTKQDTSTVQNILASGNLDGVDLIIGPTESNTADLIESFAEEKRIVHFHPFSVSEAADTVKKNYYSFSYEPHNRTIAEEVSKYAFKDIENDSILILYGEKQDDSIQAARYLELAKENNLVILGCQKIKNDNVYLLEDLIQPDSVQSIGHIFVAGHKQLLATNVISALSKSNVEVPVYCSSNWLYYPQIEYQQFLHRQIHFIYPTYIKKNSKASESFMSRYNADMKQEINQTLYGALGYDMMLFLGQSLNEHGNYFIPYLNQEAQTEGINTLGVSFNDNGYNTLVPILTFDDKFEFIWVNNPSN